MYGVLFPNNLILIAFLLHNLVPCQGSLISELFDFASSFKLFQPDRINAAIRFFKQDLVRSFRGVHHLASYITNAIFQPFVSHNPDAYPSFDPGRDPTKPPTLYIQRIRNKIHIKPLGNLRRSTSNSFIGQDYATESIDESLIATEDRSEGNSSKNGENEAEDEDVGYIASDILPLMKIEEAEIEAQFAPDFIIEGSIEEEMSAIEDSFLSEERTDEEMFADDLKTGEEPFADILQANSSFSLETSFNNNTLSSEDLTTPNVSTEQNIKLSQQPHNFDGFKKKSANFTDNSTSNAENIEDNLIEFTPYDENITLQESIKRVNKVIQIITNNEFPKVNKNRHASKTSVIFDQNKEVDATILNAISRTNSNINSKKSSYSSSTTSKNNSNRLSVYESSTLPAKNSTTFEDSNKEMESLDTLNNSDFSEGDNKSSEGFKFEFVPEDRLHLKIINASSTELIPQPVNREDTNDKNEEVKLDFTFDEESNAQYIAKDLSKYAPENKYNGSVKTELENNWTEISVTSEDTVDKLYSQNGRSQTENFHNTLESKNKNSSKSNYASVKTTDDVTSTQIYNENSAPITNGTASQKLKSKKMRAKHSSKPRQRPRKKNVADSPSSKLGAGLRRAHRSPKLPVFGLIAYDITRNTKGQHRKSKDQGSSNTTSVRVASKIRIREEQQTRASSKKITPAPSKTKKPPTAKHTQNRKLTLATKMSFKGNNTRNQETRTSVRRKLNLVTRTTTHRLPTTPFDVFKNIVQSKWALVNNGDEESVDLPPTEDDEEDEVMEGSQQVDDTIIFDGSQIMDDTQAAEDAQVMDDVQISDDATMEGSQMVDETQAINDTQSLDDSSTTTTRGLKIIDPTRRVNISHTPTPIDTPVTGEAQLSTDLLANNNETLIIIGEISTMNDSHIASDIHTRESFLTMAGDTHSPTASDSHSPTASDTHPPTAPDTHLPTASDFHLPTASDTHQPTATDAKDSPPTAEDSQITDDQPSDGTTTVEDSQTTDDNQLIDSTTIISISGAILNNITSHTTHSIEESDDESPEISHDHTDKEEISESTNITDESFTTEEPQTELTDTIPTTTEEEEGEDGEENNEEVSARYHSKKGHNHEEENSQTDVPEFETTKINIMQDSTNPSSNLNQKTLTTVVKLVRPIKTYGFDEKPDILSKLLLDKPNQITDKHPDNISATTFSSTPDSDSLTSSSPSPSSRSHSHHISKSHSRLPSKFSSKPPLNFRTKSSTKIPLSTRSKFSTKPPWILHPKLPSNHHTKSPEVPLIEIPFKIPLNPSSSVKPHLKSRMKPTLRPSKVASKYWKSSSKFPTKSYSKPPTEPFTKYYPKSAFRYSPLPSTKLPMRYTPLPYSRPRLVYPSKFLYKTRPTPITAATADFTEATPDATPEINSEVTAESSFTSVTVPTNLAASAASTTTSTEITDKFKSIIQASMAQKMFEEEEEEGGGNESENAQTHSDESSTDESIAEVTEEDHESTHEEEITDEGENTTNATAEQEVFVSQDLQTRAYSKENIRASTHRISTSKKPTQPTNFFTFSDSTVPRNEVFSKSYTVHPVKEFRRKNALYFQSPQFINSAFKYIQPGSGKVLMSSPNSNSNSDVRLDNGSAFRLPPDFVIHDNLKKKSKYKKGSDKRKIKPKFIWKFSTSTKLPKKARTKSFERIAQMNWDLLNVQDYEYEIADEDYETETTPAIGIDDQPTAKKRRERKSYSSYKNKIPGIENRLTQYDSENFNNDLMDDDTLSLKAWQGTTEQYYNKPAFKKLPLHNLALAVTSKPHYNGPPSVKTPKLLIAPDVTTENLMVLLAKANANSYNNQGIVAQKRCEDSTTTLASSQETTTISPENITTPNRCDQEVTTQNPSSLETTTQSQTTQEATTQKHCSQQVTTKNNCCQETTTQQVQTASTTASTVLTRQFDTTDDSTLMLQDDNEVDMRQQESVHNVTTQLFTLQLNQSNVTVNVSSKSYTTTEQLLDSTNEKGEMLTLRPRYNAYGVRLPPRYYDEMRTVYGTTGVGYWRKEPMWILQVSTAIEPETTTEEAYSEVEVTPQQHYIVPSKDAHGRITVPKKGSPGYFNARDKKPSQFFTMPDKEAPGYFNIPNEASGFFDVPEKEAADFNIPEKEPEYFHIPKGKPGYFHLTEKDTSGYYHIPGKDTSAYFKKPEKSQSSFFNLPKKEAFEYIFSSPKKTPSGYFKDKDMVDFYDDTPDYYDKPPYGPNHQQNSRQRLPTRPARKFKIPVYRSGKSQNEVDDETPKLSNKLKENQNLKLKGGISRQRRTTLLPTIREIRRLRARSTTTKRPTTLAVTVNSKKKQLIGFSAKRPRGPGPAHHYRIRTKETTPRSEPEEEVEDDSTDDEVQAPEAELLTYFSKDTPDPK